VRPQDDAKRLRYSLAATMLGRMCLSGDITLIPDWGQHLIDDAIAFYLAAVPVIKHGFSRRYGPPVLNYAYPDGWQAVVRTNDEHALIVIHTFGRTVPEPIELPIPAGSELVASFAGANAVRMGEGVFTYIPNADFEGAAYLFRF